jgi:hypothetical protein
MSVENKKVIIILSLLDALYPERPLLVNKAKEEIVIQLDNGAGLVIPFEVCKNEKWKNIDATIKKFI